MSDEQLRRLAEQAGIAPRWTDYRGTAREVAPATLRALLEAMELPCASAAQTAESLARLVETQERAGPPPLITARSGETLRLRAPAAPALQLELESGETRHPAAERDGETLSLRIDLPPGYHRLRLGGAEHTLAVAPAQAYGLRDAAPGRRVWGLAAQLYGLRRAGSGGIGDFTALADLAERVAAHGGDALAISPVHALFAADGAHFSPYAPSSRLFLNVLHADPALVLGSEPLRALVAERGLGDELQRLEALDLIDWPAAAAARLALLRAAYAALGARLRGAGDPLAAEFSAFVAQGGEALLDHACFEALHAAQMPAGRWSWRDWPDALRDPRAAAVQAFAAAHEDEVRFHLFAQWLAARGLAAAQRTARAAGMAIGLIGDLAVGTSAGGSHAWSRQREMLAGLSVGAPPDLLNALGQSWGLSTFSPRALVEHGYAAFLEMLRATLRHVGGLRIDHVLGLRRLWLVPEGADATEGAYLQYPFADLVNLVALESQRHRAIIVGEDLGTVPEGFRETLYDHGLMGMRVLWFERDHGFFIDPSRWPAAAMATTSTHDLPTIAGWWRGRDIDWREKLSLFAPGSDAAKERAVRQEEQRLLWGAFRHAGVTERTAPPPADEPAPAIDAALRFVAKTPSPLAIVPIEDVLGLVEQPNLPGTTDEHPNWQRRLPAEAATLLAGPPVAARLAALTRERG